jgi:uncharacterized protein (TIGR02453 family)
MIYFTKDYLQFFKELAANNHKKWFDENRKRYEATVREPFKLFIKDVITEVQKIDSEVQVETKDAIFRINRDIRFSKDKTPYKLFNSAIISKTGRKDKSYPGMYLELNPEQLAVFGGIYNPDKEQVNEIRNHIATHIDYFEKLLNSPIFLESFGAVKGNKNKRIPKEFQEIAQKQPLLYNKQWYYESSFPPKTILQDNLLEIVMEQYKIARPLQKFIIEALK